MIASSAVFQSPNSTVLLDHCNDDVALSLARYPYLKLVPQPTHVLLG